MSFVCRGHGSGGAVFEKYQNDKKALIAKGVKIVYIPPHANCSKRCQPYQGKLYSLDGTSGSIEGKSYVPIETAAELNHDKQAPHIYGSKEYDPQKNKSYFAVSEEELQKIINKRHATGRDMIYKSGQIKETIELEEDVGINWM